MEKTKKYIILMFDESYAKVENDNYVARGIYTIKNGTITVIANKVLIINILKNKGVIICI